MSAVREWAQIICFAVLACTILENLLPAGNMQKMMRFVFGLFLICAIITPAFRLKEKITLKNNRPQHAHQEIYEFSQKLGEQEVEIAAEKLKNLAVQTLAEIDVQAEKIDVFMDTREPDSISIVKLKVYLNRKDKQKKEEVRRRLEEKLGLTIQVAV